MGWRFVSVGSLKVEMVNTNSLAKLRCVLVMGLLLLTVGCMALPPKADPASLRTKIAADYPSVDGSTAEDPLTKLVACRILGASCSWSAQTTENLERSMIPDADVPEAAAAIITAIPHSGTHGAYVNLIEGSTDLIIVARAPSPDEKDAASQAGVTLDLQPIGMDAFVFLANVKNPITSLSTDQIRDIYTGKLTTWDQVGVTIDPSAASESIHAYQRDRNSGSQELMDSLIMKGTPMIDAPQMITTSMTGPFNMIGGNPFEGGGDVLGLGYTVYYYAAQMFPHQYVKMIGVNGVVPTSDSIASRSYPLTAEVYVVVRKDTPSDSTAIALRDWLLTDEGQKVVAESGYVPIRPVTP